MPGSARVEISDFFSDFTSSDVTINSSQDLNGKAVFELFYSGELVESQEVPIAMKSNESVSKVIAWQKKPQHDYYTAKVSIYEGGALLSSISYQISYGTVSLPGFHIVDFSPTNSGVQLLIRPFNPSAADIKIELLENNDIVYTKIKEDVSLTANTEITFTWPFLLTDNKKYMSRVKIFTHRLYAPPLINTYISDFTATQDVEILPDDVQVDEYGASVTIRGESQVPFDGYVAVTARNRLTNETNAYYAQMEEILVTGKEDTAGIVWKGLSSGVYDVEILAVNKENVTIDKYQTVLRIPESSATAIPTPAKKSPGFESFLLIVMLFAAAKRI
ncbi:MAG: hypothetical protein J5U17_06785 [Candidatus Methanoperedens sp.]|nr:hypothetical protein [Candidatus Methanoperedens sp.]MCE8427930.1 hypothetical protein [Candidatus Methanoperedens sp.]